MSTSEAALQEPLGRTAAVGTLWLTAQKWVARVSGIVTIAVLTRLLTPSDFGVVAAATAITPFVLLLADLGLTTYLVQARKPSQTTLSTAFWFSLISGLALGLLLFIAGSAIAAMFGIPEAGEVISSMSASVVLVVLAAVPTALLRRRMRFRTVALLDGMATLIAQAVAIALALAGAGAWALVVQLLVSQAVSGAAMWGAARWVPSAHFSLREFVQMAKFGAKVVTAEVVGTARGVAEAAVIGHALGAAALGYYAIAQRLVRVAQDVSSAAVIPVSTVVFAKVRGDLERLSAGYLKAQRVCYATVSPIMTVLAVAGLPIVTILFGQQWVTSAPVAQALAMAAILTLGAMLDNGLFYGIGSPGRWLAYATMADALTLGVTAWTAPHGLTMVAGGFVVVAIIATIARWFLVSHMLPIPLRLVASNFLRAAIAIAGSACVGLLVRYFSAPLASLVQIALISLAVLATHLAIVRLVSPQVLADAATIVPHSVRERFRRRTRKSQVAVPMNEEGEVDLGIPDGPNSNVR